MASIKVEKNVKVTPIGFYMIILHLDFTLFGISPYVLSAYQAIKLELITFKHQSTNRTELNLRATIKPIHIVIWFIFLKPSPNCSWPGSIPVKGLFLWALCAWEGSHVRFITWSPPETGVWIGKSYYWRQSMSASRIRQRESERGGDRGEGRKEKIWRVGKREM